MPVIAASEIHGLAATCDKQLKAALSQWLDSPPRRIDRLIFQALLGAALLKEPEQMQKLTRAIVDAVKGPVTVKTRLGWDDNDINAVDFGQCPFKGHDKSRLAISTVSPYRDGHITHSYGGHVLKRGLNTRRQHRFFCGVGDVSAHHAIH